MNAAWFKSALAVAAFAFAGAASAQITFYERAGFEGRSFSTAQPIDNFGRFGFNDSASSVSVERSRWEVCEDVQFRGQCVVLRPGRYPSLAAMGLNNRVSSVRAVAANTQVEETRYAPQPGAAQATFYEREGFEGQSFSTQKPIGDFSRFGFNDRASSVIVTGERWEVCDGARFEGRCAVLRPGRYASFAAMGLNNRVSSVRAVGAKTHVVDTRYAPQPVVAQATFYERAGFEGQSFITQQPITDLARFGFNDRASSVIVVGDRFEVCDSAGFEGRCAVLRPGRYASFAAMGLNNSVSSVRAVGWSARVSDDRYAPAPQPAPVNAYYRRPEERLFEAPVRSVRAVVGPPEKRCWIEREQVAQAQPQSNVNVPGAIIGAVVGGVLGHQVGGGAGKDLATVGGVAIGAAVGANVGRDHAPQPPAMQNVRHCGTVPSQARPEFWDVTYEFKGREHRVQMTTPPGPTVTVNENGEPRA